MKKFAGLFIGMTVVFIATAFFTYRISTKLSHYKEKKIEKVALLDAESRLGNAWEWVPFFNPADEIVEESNDLDRQAHSYYSSATKDGIYLLIIVVGFMIVINLIYKNPDIRSQAIGLSLVIASVSFLYLGLNAPFIELEAFKDDVSISAEIFGSEISHGIEGRIYFFYQNKSVLSLINLLYMGGNYFVAIAIIFFSIVFPIFKLISSFIIFLNPTSKYSKSAVALIDKLGKWSMADVFVAAAWLAYFSFANSEMGIDTGSSTLIGLYFFTTFVVFSIISGIYLKRTVVKAMNQKNGG